MKGGHPSKLASVTTKRPAGLPGKDCSNLGLQKTSVFSCCLPTINPI